MAGISSKEVEEVVEGIDWKVPFTNFLKRGMTTSSRSTPPLESRCNQGTLSPAVRDNLFPFVEVDDDDDPCHCIFNVLLVVSPTLQGKDDDDNDDLEENDDEDGEEDARTALLDATLPASRGDDDENCSPSPHFSFVASCLTQSRGSIECDARVRRAAS